MRKFVLLLVLSVTTVVSVAQTKATIKGKLVDSVSNQPVEFATVAVLDNRDSLSNLITYTLTDKYGVFELRNIPAEISVKVLISHAAYLTYRQSVVLGKGQILNLSTIQMRTKQLEEVVIKGERVPISLKKDTIIFDAEAFKVRPNAVVEELLKKLPGVEVDNDGTITVMNNRVSKVLVDGKRFFAKDLRIATRNLDADLIAKINVYDDRENDPDHLIPDADVNKIIDLKFKKPIKKSIFGKAYAGGGTHNYYQSAGFLNMFRDTLQVSLIGAANNLNGTGLDNSNDISSLGGTNRGGSAISRGFNTTAIGKQNYLSGGLNINTDYGKRLRINMAYFYRHTRAESNTIGNGNQFFQDTIATTRSASSAITRNNLHSISANVEWHPDTLTTIRYIPDANFTTNRHTNANTSNSFSNFINPINNRAASSSSSGNNFEFSHDFSYYRRLRKKQASFTIAHSLEISPGRSISYSLTNLTSFVSSLSSFMLNRQGLSSASTANGSVSGMLRYPITEKLVADVKLTESYNHRQNLASTYDFNAATGQYDLFVDVLNTDLSRNTFSQTLTPGFTYYFKRDINVMVHLGNNRQGVNNSFGRGSTDLNQDYFFFLPSASINYKTFSVNYNRSYSLPNVGDLVPYTIVYSPLNSVTGNPLLKPASRNNFSLRIFKYYPTSRFSFSINGSAMFEDNGVIRKRTLSPALVQTSTPFNRDGRYSYSIFANVFKRFVKRSKLQISESTNAGINTSHNFFIINNQDGFQNVYVINASQSVSLNWNDKLILEPVYRLSLYNTVYKNVNFNNRNYTTQALSTRFNLFFPGKYNLEGRYTYNYNPLVPDGFQRSSNLLSLNLAHQFLKKDRGEIRLSCYDIFNQSINLRRDVSDNSITDTQSEIVKRYFLLTLQYKLSKSKLK